MFEYVCVDCLYCMFFHPTTSAGLCSHRDESVWLTQRTRELSDKQSTPTRTLLRRRTENRTLSEGFGDLHASVTTFSNVVSITH